MNPYKVFVTQCGNIAGPNLLARSWRDAQWLCPREFQVVGVLSEVHMHGTCPQYVDILKSHILYRN